MIIIISSCNENIIKLIVINAEAFYCSTSECPDETYGSGT